MSRPHRDLPHMIGRLLDTPLAMDARKLDVIVPAFFDRMNGDQKMMFADDERITEDSALDAQGIWTIPIIGSLIRRGSWIDAYSGLTSYGAIRESAKKAAADARVKGILLRIDSYGGEAAGLFELCSDLRAHRASKPVWAICDVDALSAAYALATCANRIFLAPSGMAGSVGVVAVHLERSKMNEALGLTYTVFRAGERKADFNQYEQLAPEAASRLQVSMDRNRAAFVNMVVQNRPNLTTQAVMGTEGAWYDAEDALRLGLVDELASFEVAYQQFVDGLASGSVVAVLPPESSAPIEPDEDDLEKDDTAMKTAVEEAAVAEAAVVKEAATTVVTVAAPLMPAAVVNLPGADAVASILEIGSLCNMSGFPEKANELQHAFSSGTLSMQGVRDRLTDMRAEKDKTAEVSNVQPSAGGGGMFGLNVGAPTPAILDSWDKAFARANQAIGR